MAEKVDVLVSGAGPIGATVAGQIAEQNYKVAIIEKNNKIGDPVQCAGLVTERVLDLTNITKNSNIILNKVKGANIHSPSNKILSIGGNKTYAYVIDRSKFDKKIMDNSEEKGSQLFLKNKLISAQKSNKTIEIITSKDNSFKCKILVGADGPQSAIRDRFSLPQPEEVLIGIGAEIENTNLNPEFVEIFLGNTISPDFFAWMIPTNKDGTSARIGLCINKAESKKIKYFFKKFLNNKNTKEYLENIKITKKIAGQIPLGLIKKTYSSNVLLVGDAAAQVKPTSGGGIYTGLLSANHCSKTALEALKNHNYTENFLKKYQTLWQKEISREITAGMKFRKIFKKIDDSKIDKYINILNDKKTIQIINKYGDIDYPSKLIKPLLIRKPSLLRLLPEMYKKIKL